jgi:methyl-accepting chemotaxis protein
MEKIKWHNKISSRFIIVFSELYAISIIILIIIFFSYSEKYFYSEIYKQTSQTITLIESSLDDFIRGQVDFLNAIVTNRDIVNFVLKPENYDKIAEYLSQLCATNKACELITPINHEDTSKKFEFKGKIYEIKKGAIIMNVNKDGSVDSVGGDLSWTDYVKVLDHGKKYYVGRAYKTKYMKESKAILTVSCPVVYNNKVIGSVVIGLRLDYLTSDLIRNYKIGENGYVFIINDKGRILSHPNYAFILNENIEEETKKIQKNALTLKPFTETFRGEEKYYIPFKHSIASENIGEQFYYIFAIPRSHIMHFVYTAFRWLIYLCISFYIFLLILIKIFAFILFEKHLRSFINSIKELSTGKGDLSKKISIDMKNEFMILGIYYNDLISNVAEIILKVKEMIGRTNEITDNVKNVMSNVSKSSNKQLEQLRSVASSMEELSATSAEVAEDAVASKKKAESSKGKTTEGQNTLLKVADGINTIATNMHQLKESIDGFADKTSDINKILNTISEVASQTNLLALNAAIEAARAGEMGRGFEVVAAEVRKLAIKTSDYTGEIANIVKTINNEYKDLDAHNKKMEESVHMGKKLISAASGVYEEIVSISNDTFEHSIRIENSNLEQAKTIKYSSNEAQQITMAIEEVLNNINNVDRLMNQLESQLKALTDTINFFKVGQEI